MEARSLPLESSTMAYIILNLRNSIGTTIPTTPATESAFLTGILDKLPILEVVIALRVVIDNAILRRIILSFDVSQVFTEHTSPRVVIIQLLSGRMRFRVGGVTHGLIGGDVARLVPGDRHAPEVFDLCYMALTPVDVENTAYAAKGILDRIAEEAKKQATGPA